MPKNGCHSADNILKCIILNEEFCVLILMSLKFVPNCKINKMPAVTEMMTICIYVNILILCTVNVLAFANACWHSFDKAASINMTLVYHK